MKKYFNIALAAFAMLSLSIACNKDAHTPEGQNNPGEDQGLGTITITATLSDALTRVDFEPSYTDGKPTGMALTWAEGDMIRVYNHDDRTQYEDFTLVASAIGQKEGQFTGNAIAASSYDVEVINGDFNYAAQTQPSDGVTTGLKYMASASGISDYTDIEFSSFSSVLAITAKMPSTAAAAAIKSVDITANDDIFNGGRNLTITIDTPGDADSDGILHLFATLPVGDQAVPDETTLLVHFNAPGTDHTIYTRYIELGQNALTFTANKLNTININATMSDTHAGLVSCDGSTAQKAYLIGDKYQLKAVNDEMEDDVTKYFKMIDDVDMDEENWTHLNATKVDNDYKKKVDFNGNNKTISHLNKDLFYVLKGSVYDLTLDVCDVDARGILAEYIQGTGNFVTNITISNGKLSYTGQAESDKGTGGLIGTINSGSGTVATIANCVVSNTNVTGKGVVGGVIGFADQLISMSGCSYTDGTVTATARYAGGMIASTSNYSSVISDCHVENATITSSSDRFGGFAGLLHTKVVVKGCSVGTSLQQVIVNSTQTTATANAGGFAGVNYGKITQNEDIRSKAYVAVKSSNVTIGNSMNIGGFVGYNTGTIEYCDADVMMPELKGQYIGGFCGVILQSGVIKNSTETGIVTGNNYTGGFVGAIDSATTKIEDCTSAGSVSAASSIGGFAGGCTALGKSGYFANNSSSASVTSSGSNFGGFIGNGVGSFISNFATGNVVSTGGGNGGGFAGGIWEKSTGSVFSKNYATGSVSGNANLGGLIGYIGGNLDMSNCYATGNVGTSNQLNQKYGGLVGFTTDKAENSTSITISNCYAIGDVEASFASAGLIGRIGLASCSVSNCAAWNSKVFPHTTGSGNWSSAAVVGVAFPTCTLTNNYRNPSMDLTAYWVPGNMATFQHADVSSDHPLTDSTGIEMVDTATASGQPHYPQYPYHGKVKEGKTLTELAIDNLGWDDSVWDFSTDLPTLK